MTIKKSSLTPILQFIFSAFILIVTSSFYLKTYQEAVDVRRQAEAAKAVEVQAETPQAEEKEEIASEPVAEEVSEAVAVEQVQEVAPVYVQETPVVDYVAPVPAIEEIVVAESPVVLEPAEEEPAVAAVAEETLETEAVPTE